MYRKSEGMRERGKKGKKNYSLSSDIPEEWQQRWASLPQNPELFISTPNPFIPDNFDLITPEEEVPDYPERVVEEERGTVWFRRDVKFQLPRTHCCVYLLSDDRLRSPKM